jgi:hypothetical protein
MSAADVAFTLGKPRREGRRWRCLCPLHGGHSLTLADSTDGKVLFTCWAGCDRRDLVAEFRRRNFIAGTPNARQVPPERTTTDNDRRVARAIAIWRNAGDPGDTLVEAYLAARALKLPPELHGRVIRFHRACPWRNKQTDKVDFIPAMIVAFTSTTGDEVTAIHRIRLDRPERWPRTERMMLGVTAGAAIKLDAIVDDKLAIGEGIETALAARELGFAPVWALGSATQIEKFRPIAGIKQLTILGETDQANRQAIERCAQAWIGERHRIFVAMPANGAKDFNELLMQRTKNESSET